jgi:hypothetical protein
MKLKFFWIIAFTAATFWQLWLSYIAERAGNFDEATYGLLWACLLFYCAKSEIARARTKP